MLAAALITGLWGGLLALERRAFLQAAVSRPLPAAVGLSVMLGDVEAGLMVGLVFELFHLSGASLGGAHPDHETLPAVTATALATALGHTMGAPSTPALWSLTILLCAPAGIVGRLVELRLDSRARRYFGRALSAVSSGGIEGIAWQNVKAMWPHFVFYGLASAVAVPVALVLHLVVGELPLASMRGLALAYPVLGMVAAGLAIFARGQGRPGVAAAVAVVVAAIVAFFTLRAR